MTFRHAQNTKHDCDLIFRLSNDPFVRAASFNSGQIEYGRHCEWFAMALADANTLFFLVFEDESERDFVGQIRFKRESEDSSECVISLSVTEQFRGRHIAKQFIELGIEEMRKKWYNVSVVVAEVKGENTASNALFLKEGFRLISQVNTYKLSVLPTSDDGGGVQM